MKVLLKLMDPKTLVAGITPVFLGSCYSYYKYEQLNGLYFVLILIGVILIQSCANMVNDLYDYRRGADAEHRSDEKALASGEASQRKVKRIIGLFLLGDALIGIYFAIYVHWGILVVGLFGALVLYLYSAGPFPISHTPFGELVAGSTMGFGIVTTVIYIHSAVVSLDTILVAVPTAIYIGTILLTNNLSDHHEDKESGRKTLPIVLGVSLAENIWLMNAGLLILLTMIYSIIGLWSGICVLTVLVLFPYKQVLSFKKINKKVMNKGKMMGLVGQLGIRFHLGLIVGLVISALIW